MNVTAFKEAQEAYARGDYARALQGFTVCTQELGDLSAADLSKFYHLIGNCYIKNAEPANAAKYYQKALDNSSKSRKPALYVNLGTALLNARDYENALQAFEAALSYPAYATPYRAYSGIGAAQLKLGNTTEAGAAYREAALDPANPMPAKALVNLGVCFMELGRPADAIVSYETALDFDLDPIALAKAQSNLGQAYMAEGRVQKAIEAFESVVEGGVYELTPIARHDYEIALRLKDRLDSKMPGILNTGFIPKVVAEGEGAPQDDEPADPFEPKPYEGHEEGAASEPAALEPEGTAAEPAQDAQGDGEPEPQEGDDADAAEAAVEEPAETAEVAEFSESAEPAASDQPDTPAIDVDFASAPTVAFAAVEEGKPLDIDPGTGQFAAAGQETGAVAVGDPSQTAEQAFAELDKEEDALPSPEDTAFFDVTETEINTAAKDDMRKERKRRGAGLKAAIAVVVVCIILAGAACAAYFCGYGVPTQEYVAEQFVTAAQAGEDTSAYWADNVDENSRATQLAILGNANSFEVQAVERSMSQSIVYVKGTLEEGGEVYYEVVMGRKGVSWSVQYVELYFPSE